MSSTTLISINVTDTNMTAEEALVISDLEQCVLAILAEHHMLNTTVLSPLTGEPIYTPLYTPATPRDDGPLEGIMVVSPRSMTKTISEFEPDYQLFDDVDYHDE